MKNLKKIQGFTVVEMLAVVAVIAILMSFLIPKILGVANTAKAKVMVGTANDIQNALKTLATQCQTSSAIANNPLPASGKTIYDVLFSGADSVATAYQSCYAQAQVTALTDVSQPGASAGTYTIKGANITLTGGGTVPLQVLYSALPDELTLAMANQFGSLSELAASDSTSKVLQYTALSGSARDVTVIRQ